MKRNKLFFDEKLYKSAQESIEKIGYAAIGICGTGSDGFLVKIINGHLIKIINMICYCPCTKCYEFIQMNFENFHSCWKKLKIVLGDSK